jgi:ferredoxin
MKVKIDLQLCQGHGVCMGEASEVFKVRDGGKVEILQEQPPERLQAMIEKAVKYCPTQAISIIRPGPSGSS